MHAIELTKDMNFASLVDTFAQSMSLGYVQSARNLMNITSPSALIEALYTRITLITKSRSSLPWTNGVVKSARPKTILQNMFVRSVSGKMSSSKIS